MITTYKPNAGSLASMTTGFFRNNPDEVLTLDDISDKFNATRGNIHTLLRPAMDAGLLERSQDTDGEYIYRAGPQLLAKVADLPVEAGAAPVADTPKRAAPSGYNSPRHAIDIAALKIDVGVPYLPAGHKGQSKWEPLFARMTKADQSIALPGNVKSALAAAVVLRNKQKRGTFKIAMTSANEARLWRIA